MKRQPLALWLIISFGILFLLASCQSKKYVAITTGDWHVCALTDQGEVDCWGDNSHGQIGSGGDYAFSMLPVAVKGISNVKLISAGGDHTCAVDGAGKAFCWGNDQFGQLGDTGSQTQNSAVAVKDTGVVYTVISAGEAFTCALTAENAVYCWGKNDLGQLGNGTAVNSALPVKANGLLEGKITRLESEGEHTCLWLEAGGIWCWGQNFLDKSKGPNLSAAQITDSQTQFRSVVERDNFSCFLSTTGAVQCWGRNAEGELGNGSNTDSSTPVAVQGLQADVASIAGGDSFGCALTRDGSVQCWGNNQFSQLGDGTTNSRNVPAVVSGLDKEIQSLSAGYNFACALSAAGEVSCWGTIDSWNSSIPHTFQ